jgi:hypothetical protein
MSPVKPEYYGIPANEANRVEELPDGSLKFLHRSGEWKVVAPGTWSRLASSGSYNIKWADYLSAMPTDPTTVGT